MYNAILFITIKFKLNDHIFMFLLFVYYLRITDYGFQFGFGPTSPRTKNDAIGISNKYLSNFEARRSDTFEVNYTKLM